ncbi:hypothetical protein NDU88_009693 [Pleurodeles waltl]|uniref:Uncharacterized protein n=1 Tax=Pleurodeles waltl TaxID=8319 RepID=A0AAV7PT67_PLEWA|nr:hypothetical protein NDU88_009693 [Pleurodeles waltl]
MVEGGKWWSMRNVVKVAVPVPELNKGLSDSWFDGGYDVNVGDGSTLERGVCEEVRQGGDLQEGGPGPLLGSSEGDFRGDGALDVGSGTHTTCVLDQTKRSKEGNGRHTEERGNLLSSFRSTIDYVVRTRAFLARYNVGC